VGCVSEQSVAEDSVVEGSAFEGSAAAGFESEMSYTWPSQGFYSPPVADLVPNAHFWLY
jgi:hypothetical protein